MRTMRMLGVAALAAVLLAAVTAQAATLYVDVKWSGPFNGTAAEPYQSLGQAFAAYANGDTIRVAIGEYKIVAEGGYETFGDTGYEETAARYGHWYGGYVGWNGSSFDWSSGTRTFPDPDTLSPSSVTVVNLTNANARAFNLAKQLPGGNV